MKKIIATIILLGTIVFNLYIYRSENTILADPNDNIFQYSLIYRTNWVWENYGCPFSLSCFPNLIDHNVTTWAEGYPLPLYYPHIPQILTVASYHLLVSPLASIFNPQYSLFQYYTLTKYLLLSFFPLSIFIALLIAGFNPVLGAVTSFFVSQFSTDGLYGIDPTSFLWRGYGLTSQLYGMIFFPIAIALTYRALKQINKTGDADGVSRLGGRTRFAWIILAGLGMTATTTGHLGMGVQALLLSSVFIFFDLTPRLIAKRIQALFAIGAITVGLLSYWIIPAMLYDHYHINSFWDPIWKFNSYGAYEVIRQLVAGEIFDWKRIPVITFLVIAGFFIALTSPGTAPLGFAFILAIFFYFGRTTWGGLIDLIPGMNGYHLHRFIVAVQFAGVFLIPLAIGSIYKLLNVMLNSVQHLLNHFPKTLKLVQGNKKTSLTISKITLPIVFILLIISLAYYTSLQTIEYSKPNDKWISEANTAYRYDEKNFRDLVAYLTTQPNSRIYAGRPGNWGKNFRLGSTQMYMMLGIYGFDMSQFLPETWSPLSENEQNFDERTGMDYDLLNIGHVVATKNENFSPEVTPEKKFGPFEVFKSPTSGWFDIVTVPMLVETKKTDFINIVHLWHRSYSRLWKMHPLISVDRNPKIPSRTTRIIKMTDPANYEEEGIKKNIFSDFPLVFPDATPSGKIISEKVEKQTYTGIVDVPNNCKQCFVMFKMSYHPDWRLKVDGQEAPKFAVFPFYLAAEITPGRHTVEFTYKPNMLKVILLFTTPLVVLILGFLVWKKIIRT